MKTDIMIVQSLLTELSISTLQTFEDKCIIRYLRSEVQALRASNSELQKCISNYEVAYKESEERASLILEEYNQKVSISNQKIAEMQMVISSMRNIIDNNVTRTGSKSNNETIGISGNYPLNQEELWRASQRDMMMLTSKRDNLYIREQSHLLERNTNKITELLDENRGIKDQLQVSREYLNCLEMRQEEKEVRYRNTFMHERNQSNRYRDDVIDMKNKIKELNLQIFNAVAEKNYLKKKVTVGKRSKIFTVITDILIHAKANSLSRELERQLVAGIPLRKEILRLRMRYEEVHTHSITEDALNSDTQAVQERRAFKEALILACDNCDNTKRSYHWYELAHHT